MIGHVASAGEARGRVVLRYCSGSAPNEAAFEAAARIAQAFESEIEGLFVEDLQLLDLTGYPFTREIALSGRVSRGLSVAAMEEEFHSAFRAMRRRMEAVAKRYKARSYATRVRDDPLTALARACARAGPWNVIVMGEPLRPRSGRMLSDILETVRDATGLVALGPKSKARARGPVVVVVEEPDRLLSMMRTAERLAAASSQREGIVALLSGDTSDYLDWLEGQARLVLAHGPEPRFVLAPPARGEPAVIAEALRQLKGGFVISRFGGLLVPADDLKPLTSALESPLFLVR